MSVGGDGKGRHEKEPEPQDDPATSGEDFSADSDSAFTDAAVDVPPYEAITEVMRAIDPNEPAPAGVGSRPQGDTPADIDDVTADHAATEDAATDTPGTDTPGTDTPGTDALVADAMVADDEGSVDEVAEEPHEARPEPEPEDSATVALPIVAAPSAPPTASGADAADPTVFGPTVSDPTVSDSVTADPAAGASRVRDSRIKTAVIVGAAVAIVGVFYAADMLSSNGSVPRGVTVAGIEIGGLGHADAEAKLQADLGPRVDQSVRVDAGDQQLEIVPSAAGLGIDWTATLDRAGSQPINPFTRLASFFSSTEIGVSSTVDPVAFDDSVESIRAQTDRDPSEGDVVFEGTTPVAVTPAPGQSMDVVGAREALRSDWAFGAVEVPVEVVDVTVHQDEVDRVLAEVATPAVSAPVVFSGRNNTEAVLAPDAIARILTFEPDGEGALSTRYDIAGATGLLAPSLASTETPPKDASFALGGGAPTVVPGVVGELVQWEKTLEQLPALLTSTDARTAGAVYEQAQPALTTDGAQALGIKEVVGEYTTGGFEYASGVNIGLTADIVNGALVKPGATFSLNDYTGPRGTAQGFVESGIIDNGRPDRAVGGGISQFATTLYNAAYFGGMDDAGHTEHSYYISRYPEAREATVFEGAIDLKFTNPTKTGIVIESFATSSDVTVRLWGTKTVDVESVTGARTNPTSPNTITLPAGPGCVASGGGPGFTASDTRVITDIASGNQISSNTRTVKYDPIPIVKCESPEPDPKPADEPAATPPAAEEPESGE